MKNSVPKVEKRWISVSPCIIQKCFFFCICFYVICLFVFSLQWQQNVKGRLFYTCMIVFSNYVKSFVFFSVMVGPDCSWWEGKRYSKWMDRRSTDGTGRGQQPGVHKRRRRSSSSSKRRSWQLTWLQFCEWKLVWLQCLTGEPVNMDAGWIATPQPPHFAKLMNSLSSQ